MARPLLTDDEVEVMRSRLAEAALEIYLREGLEAVSFRRLAEAAGVSHTLPYRYFSNKEAVLARMRTDAVRRLEQFVIGREPATLAPMARIRAVAMSFVDFVRRHPAEYMLIFSTHQPPPDQYPELLAARRSLFDHAVDVVQQSIDAGEISGSARELAHALWVSLHGLLTLHVANQLVHGFDMEHLIGPVLDRLLQVSGERSAKAAAAKPTSVSRSIQVPRRGAGKRSVQ